MGIGTGSLNTFESLFSGGSGSDIYGKKVRIPSLDTLENSQSDAVKANIASFADIAKLATTTDAFNQQQLEQLMERVLPGAKETIRANIASRLRGEIPDDVRSSIARGNSERFAGVFSGSNFARSNEAKQLGLTSLDLMDSGLSSAESWLAHAKAPSFDVTSMFITPQQKYADANNQFSRELLANKMEAAPDPVTRGRFDTTMGLIGMAAGIFSGGPGYQGSYNQEQNFAGGGGDGFGGTNGPGGFYIGGNNWGFGRTQSPDTGGAKGGNWFFGKGPGKG